MLVVMKAQATEGEVRAVCRKIESLGYRAHSIPGAQRTAIGITGNQGEVETGTFDEMPGVQEVIRVSKPYKLVSRDVKPDNIVIGPDRTRLVTPVDQGSAERWQQLRQALQCRGAQRRVAQLGGFC